MTSVLMVIWIYILKRVLCKMCYKYSKSIANFRFRSTIQQLQGTRPLPWRVACRIFPAPVRTSAAPWRVWDQLTVYTVTYHTRVLYKYEFLSNLPHFSINIIYLHATNSITFHNTNNERHDRLPPPRLFGHVLYLSLKGFELAISCVRDQGASTAPATHMRKTRSLN